MAALSWDEICEKARQNNKEVICEVEKSYDRKFLVKCLNCSNESIVLLRNLSYSKTCRKCYQFSQSKEQALIIAKKHNVELLSYVGKRSDKHHRWSVKCNKCNNIKDSIVRDFDKCQVCRANNQRFSKEDFIEKAKLIHGEKFNYDFAEYINSITKVKIFCNLCKKIFLQPPGSHLRGNGCLTCSGYKKYTKEEFTKKAKDIHGIRFDYNLVDYVNTETKVKIFCNKCKEIFLQAPHNHLGGNGCPVCKLSKGEIKVANFLSGKKIFFEKQKIFDNLISINHLKFDFYLPELNLLIEYDGEGHYKLIFGSTIEDKKKNLEYIQKNDQIKNQWAIANNIPLLRIPYWNFNRIEELIEAFILEHTKKKEIKQSVLEM